MKPRFAAIIVTHNSANVLERCVEALCQQSRPVDEIIVIDSGSDDPDYLGYLEQKFSLNVVKQDNIGFARSNNLGLTKISRQVDSIIFLNPDTFLASDFVQRAVDIFKKSPHIGFLSGKLLGYDPLAGRPTGRIDSTGVLRKWYGRWYDRGHGEKDTGHYDMVEEVPALCGALLCCRRRVIDLFGGTVFDPDFFMYKEDVELGLRAGKKGVKFLYHPDLIAYHCRGWNRSRKTVQHQMKMLSAKNEILLYRKHPSPYMIWALLKYILVTVFKV